MFDLACCVPMQRVCLPGSNLTCSLLTGLLSPRRRSCLCRASNRTTVSRQVKASPADRVQGTVIPPPVRAEKKGSPALTVRLRGDPPLRVRGQALAQPHLLPGGVGDGVPEPAVRDLVDDVDQQELAALQDGGDDEGEAGVLHGDDGEGWGEEDDVTPEKQPPSAPPSGPTLTSIGFQTHLPHR